MWIQSTSLRTNAKMSTRKKPQCMGDIVGVVGNPIFTMVIVSNLSEHI